MTPWLLGLLLGAGLLLITCGLYGGHLTIDVSRLRRLPVGLLVGAVILGALGWLVTGWPVAGFCMAAAVFGLRPVLRASAAAQQIERLEALADWCTRLAELLRSGAGGLHHALVASARTAPPQLAEPLTTLAGRLRAEGIDKALREFADLLADPDADAVVASLLLRATAGGSGLVAVLDGQVAALRRTASDRRDIESDRAKPRTQAKIVLLIVSTVLAILIATSGPLMATYDTTTGQVWLAGIAGIFAAAIYWMHRLTSQPPTLRLFTSPPRGGS
ncbi:pilus assembly protein TadB [Pseudonocardiaceae bacterium YIM PH 21723]|nr:pilus assembly protein TadB [Pseudonocardiaceae bacterium YIM PH 21723]